MGFDFEAVDALDYDELRPTYAPEAVAWVAERAGLGAASTVIDLAAGTGQLSRRFASIGCRVIAVEPASNMRAVLRDSVPEVTALAGTAETIPAEKGLADAVVIGNAFHHFQAGRAFGEIRRVLRPGGALALFWARSEDALGPALPGDSSIVARDPATISVIREIERVVERVRGASEFVEAYRSWYEPRPAEGFTSFERRYFPITHEIPSDRVADLYATSSDIASLPPDVRGSLLARIAGLAAGLPQTLELRERSDVMLSFRT
jgi:SAM-dependent methyltransferase